MHARMHAYIHPTYLNTYLGTVVPKISWRVRTQELGRPARMHTPAATHLRPPRPHFPSGPPSHPPDQLWYDYTDCRLTVERRQQERRLTQKMLDDTYPGLYNYQLQLATDGKAELAVGGSVLSGSSAGAVADAEGLKADAASACAACSAASSPLAVLGITADSACSVDGEADASPCAYTLWFTTWQRVFLVSIAAEAALQ